MICVYVFFEYVRPQSIMPQLDVLPWTRITLILVLLGLLGEMKGKSVSDAASKWLIIFFMVILLCSFTAYWPEFAYRKLFGYYSWVIIYFLIINIVNTRERFIVFITFFLLCLVKVSLFGARTWAMRGFSFTDWGMVGPPGYFENSGELAIQMIMFSFISFQLINVCKPWISARKYKFMVFIFPVTGMMTIMASSSRGGQLALLAAIVFYFAKNLDFKKIALAGIILSFGYLILPAEQKARFSEMGDDPSSIQRLYYWEHGIDMWQDHKFKGVGYFNFIPYYSTHYKEHQLFLRVELPHNIFIQIVAELGTLGLIVYLILIRLTFLSDKKNPTSIAGTLAPGFNAAFVGFLIAGQFVSVAYYPFMWIHLAMVASLRNISKKHSGDSKN